MRTFLHRKLGLMSPSAGGFFDREEIPAQAFNRNFRADPAAPVASDQFESLAAWYRTRYDQRSEQAFIRADNFLLLVNSGALAGAITLATRGDGEIDLVFGASIALFFVSIAFLGLSKWCLIAHTHFVRGEFFKNYVRFKANRLSELELIEADYRANGNRTYFGLFAAASFLTFIFGWILLVAPILSPNGVVSTIARQSLGTVAAGAASGGVRGAGESGPATPSETVDPSDDGPP